MPELVVSRPDDYGGRLRRLKVFVDGAEVGGLLPRDKLGLAVRDGEHVVHAAMDWTRSPDLVILVAGTDVAAVEVSLPFSAVVRSFLTPRRAVGIRRLGA